ncbi:MAG: hypothetical protein GYA24_22955, partial [Candidatus Lokiarchaeota archaeon]|nr:hypothetical protein [Candidatus Lokiarchaeota archaeon]
AGQRWAFGYEEHHDWDGDGADDFTRQARDVFDDASWWGGRTYETKTDTIASWRWDTNASRWVRHVTVTTTNDLLVEGMTIQVLGLDQNVTADFVIVDGVDVLVDPRASVPGNVRVARNGSLFWFDSNGDGTFEAAYVFTNQTRWKAVPEAVGILLDHDGDNRCDTRAVLAGVDQLADAYVPVSWLSSSAGYKYITEMAYEDAWQDYLESLEDPAMWGRMIADTAFQVVNMIAMMAISTAVGSACGPIGSLVGLAVGFVIGLLSNMAWKAVADTIQDMIAAAVAKNPDQGTNLLDDGKMEGVTFLSADGYQVGETMSADEAAMQALGGVLSDLFTQQQGNSWNAMLPPGAARKYYWRGIVATGTANATRTYSLGTVWGAQIAGKDGGIDVKLDWAASTATRHVVDDTVGVVLRVPDVWLAPSDVAAWWDFALGWLPWKFDWSASNSGMPIPGTDWSTTALAQYSAEAKRAVFAHFTNHVLPGKLATAAARTNGELDGITVHVDDRGRVSFQLVNSSIDRPGGTPCTINSTSPAGAGAMAAIAAYAGLYQATYDYTKQRDARIQG